MSSVFVFYIDCEYVPFQLFQVKIDKIMILMKHLLKFGNELWRGVLSVR